MTNVADKAVDLTSLYRVAGQTSLITGGAAGMGRQIALALSTVGCRIVVFDRAGEEASGVAHAIVSRGGEAIAVQGDVTDRSDVEAAVAHALERFGAIDVLVNNAGILSMYDFLDMRMEEWDHVMDVNLRGALLFMKAVIPGMVDRGRGSVINIGSSWSSKGAIFNQDGGGPDYCVSKAAIQALTKTAAQDVAHAGVRVNAIAPGAVVDTPMQAHQRDKVAKNVVFVPMGRLQLSTDIVGTILYLASDASAFVTGQTIHVNGGMLMVD